MEKSKWKTPKSIIKLYSKYKNKESMKNSNKEFNVGKNFKIIETVGRGAYGLVVGAKNKKTNKMVAIKKL